VRRRGISGYSHDRHFEENHDPQLIQLLFLALLPSLVLAETAEQQQARVDRLEHAVLAPCCYTEPVAIHQSEIAVKMRLEIAKWVAAGRSDREIIDTYVSLYGSKVLVDPRTVPRGWMPFFPWLVLILGMFLVAWLLKRWHATPRTATASSTTEFLNLPNVDDE
jgi:cytochrome c-type biogenesis protein CcmH/NrfF